MVGFFSIVFMVMHPHFGGKLKYNKIKKEIVQRVSNMAHGPRVTILNQWKSLNPLRMHYKNFNPLLNIEMLIFKEMDKPAL